MEENTLKTKQEILTALAHSGDDKLLLAGLLDKEQTCEQRGYLTHTKFLDLKQRALCTDAGAPCRSDRSCAVLGRL